MSKYNRVVIFANGEYNNFEFYRNNINENDYIIAVDGGSNYTYSMGIVPHVIVGDLDSIKKEVYENYKYSNTPFVKFPSEKDKSDLELAIIYAMKRNVQEILVYGALGKRADHFYANIMVMLEPLNKGVSIFLVDELQTITVISDKVLITGKIGDYISLFPITPKVTGIYTKGVKYSLEGDPLYIGSSLGLSNEFVDDEVTIEISDGLLLIIKTKNSDKT
ncbi:thiamine diphosphokinase [Natranaerobius trueperi]|uniref:thiamine diphosphokinase n=1 Tax=Natranaerobius trueperi TaxID=759412 RepID=UPI001303C4E0|nr:thiamine diphosphokinase [Natranaerobius trueperi]